MSVKLLVADDEDTIRRGVVKYLQLHTDRFDKIYEAENGQEAIDAVLKFQPDMILLDVQMPLKNGIEVMKEAIKAGLNPVIIILSGYDEFKYARHTNKVVHAAVVDGDDAEDGAFALAETAEVHLVH